MNEKSRQQIKEEIIEEFWLIKGNKEEDKAGGIILNRFLNSILDLAISKTAKAIFDDIENISGGFDSHTEWNELKKKYCDEK